MKVSHRGLYALKALAHLAESHERGLVKIREIAHEESIPEKFLEGILVTLKNARRVASQRGRDGCAAVRLRRSWWVRSSGSWTGPWPFGTPSWPTAKTEPRHPGLFDLSCRSERRRHPRP
jgi:hypothetical protein